MEEYTKHGKSIISNNHLEGIPYTQFDLKWFVENMVGEASALENCVVWMDEAYQYFDSRLSQSKINRLFTYFIVQTRKRGVDLYICTHNLDHIDLRARRAVDIRGACSYFPEDPCSRCKGNKDYREGKHTIKVKEPCENCKGEGKVEVTEPCDACSGSGQIAGWVTETCKACKGSGRNYYSMCTYCFGTGIYKGILNTNCEKCGGLGFIEGQVVECSICKGKGTLAIGKEVGEGEPCQRCLGYGSSGIARVHFLRVRGRGGKRRFTMEVFAPKYWGYYSTRERMPMQEKLMKSIDTAEVY